MKKFTFIAVLSLLSIGLFAQDQTFSSSLDSDPEATAILDDIRATFDAYNTAEYNFNIDIEIPGQAMESPEGNLIQKGEKFVFTFGDQIVYNDNETVWMYDTVMNIVQIYDADFGDEGAFISPTELLEIYNSDDYSYAIVNEYFEGQTVMKHIDFKPLDQDSDFFKVRLELKGENNDINSVKVFAKDGSRYTLRIKDILPNENIEDDFFVFNASNYENIQIENLRID